MKKLALALTLSIATILSGCATHTVYKMGGYESGSEWINKEHLFSDEYIAIGKPTKPIAGYDSPLILAGKKSSLILTLSNKNKDLFENVLQEKQLLPYLNISLSGGYEDARAFLLSADNKNRKNIIGIADLYFIKPLGLFSEQDKSALEKLGFERRDNSDKDSCYTVCGEHVIYRKIVTVKMDMVGRINNVNQLTHYLKQPIQMDFYQEKTNTRRDIAGAFLLPAVIIDMITLPVQFAVGSAIDKAN